MPLNTATRVIEIAIAVAAIVVSALPMLAIALMIRVDSPGRALFWQTRLGLDGRPFHFVKFRTLYADARQRWPELYVYRYSPEELEHLRFKIEDDPRVTRVGRWLRPSSLDELPNFWNVMIGDMALVGPRPEIPEMLQYYSGVMMRKFTVRPGITGLAQISGRGRLMFHETVGLDLEYVRTRSTVGDLKILLSTIVKVVLRQGAF